MTRFTKKDAREFIKALNNADEDDGGAEYGPTELSEEEKEMLDELFDPEKGDPEECRRIMEDLHEANNDTSGADR